MVLIGRLVPCLPPVAVNASLHFSTFPEPSFGQYDAGANASH